MSDNVFAPPKANLEREASEEAPALWNPNAAANWCLLLSTAFGAYLHMKNWQALGEADLALASRRWLIVSVAVLTAAILGSAFFPRVSLAVNAAGFILLISWYFASARAQARYVRERFGDTYPRKGWLLPIFLGFVILYGTSIAVGLVIGFARVAIHR